ncbi:MAG: hypothetical protein AAB877_01970 [Patescibacteria group bacterium]
MKLSVTDKFLWDLYKLLSGMGYAIGPLLGPRRSIVRLFPHNRNPVCEKYKREKGSEKFSKLIYYLKKNNYIKVKNLENKQAVILTKEGIGKALRASFNIEGKKKREDGKWIMLIFDIPEKNRQLRDLLRSVLYNLGYKMFQQSVWITPYDVSEKTEGLIQTYSLDNFVKIFLIEKI